MAVIREITFGDGTVVRITDWGDYPVWSRLVLTSDDLVAPLPQEVYLFNYTQGQAMPMDNRRATIADTNMPAPGQLPMGHQMLVYSLQVIPDEFAAAAVGGGRPDPLLITPEATWLTAMIKWRKIMFQTLLTLTVEQSKAFVEGRLDHFPQGGGFVMQNGGGDLSTDGAYEIYNGDRTWMSTRRLAMPVHLGSLESFYVALRWPRGGLGANEATTSYQFFNGFGLQVRMTGPRQRPTA